MQRLNKFFKNMTSGVSSEVRYDTMLCFHHRPVFRIAKKGSETILHRGLQKAQNIWKATLHCIVS